MIRAVMLSIVLIACAAARGDVVMGWSGATATIVVAHDGQIEGFDRTGEKKLWSAKGLTSPSSTVFSQDGTAAAILDSYADRVALVSVVDGKVALHDTRATPVAAAYFENDVWIVLRDRSRVLRITPDGKETEVAVALDPALIAVSDLFVYVYSRAEGLVQEIDPKSAQVTRSKAFGSAASDFEIRMPRSDDGLGAKGFLCRPERGMIVTIDLVSFESSEAMVGVAAPFDVTFVPFGAKLWIDPFTAVLVDAGKQALMTAKDPGLGNRVSLPTPASRVMVSGAGVLAFDSENAIVYRVEGRTFTKVASGVTATSFVGTDEAIFTWDSTAGRPRSESRP